MLISLSQLLLKAENSARKIAQSSPETKEDILSLNVSEAILAGLSLIAIIAGIFYLLRKPSGQRIKLTDQRENKISIFIAAGIFLLAFIISGLTTTSLTEIFQPGKSSKSEKEEIMSFITLVTNIPSIILILYASKALFKNGLAGLGFPKLSQYAKNILKGIYYFFAAYLPVLVALILTAMLLQLINHLSGTSYKMQVHDSIPAIKQMGSLGQLLFGIGIAFIVPIFEELVFRGIIQTSFRNYMSPILSIMLGSVFFAAMHADITHFFALFVLSCFMGYSYEKTGKIIVPITVHVCFNSTVLILNIAAVS